MQAQRVAKKNAKGGKKKAPSNGRDIRQATSSLKVSKPLSDSQVRSVPAAMGSLKITGRPKTEPVGSQGDCRIVHREYLGDVPMAASFQSNKYAINPGLARTFPWLSTVANRYESYRFNRLRFCFETSCSSTQTGSVLLIPDYDAIDAAPLDKIQALSYRNSARAQAWLSFCQESSREDLNKQKSYFVRPGANPAGTDIRLFDVGNMFLCVQGSDTNTVGELWVEYDVHLMTPQISGEIVAESITGGGVISAAAIFGNSPVQQGALDVTASGSTLTFNQAYEGLLSLFITGTVLTTPLVLTGSSTHPASMGMVVNAGGTQSLGVTKFKATPGQTLIFGSPGATATASFVQIGSYEYELP